MGHADQKQTSPCVECPQGRWLTIENNNLHYIGLYAGDLVCVVPAVSWPVKGPVLMREQGEDKICYVQTADDGNSIRIHEHEGSWKYIPTHSARLQLVGWIVRVVRYLEEPEAPSLHLVENKESCLEKQSVHPASQSIPGDTSTPASCITMAAASGANGDSVPTRRVKRKN